ncbi:hypothetical protein TWF281_007875 [Arthrobotrys megalospora]
MLDEQHEQLPTKENDDNTYTLGRVGRHNVVIARPAEYGTNSAANTSANMVRTFQNLRFVLMVGIGGGAPGPPVSEDSQEEDIRLGDVVVGFPKDSHSGVLQYDMGKLEHCRQFTIRSHLNKPPKVLLTAVGTLQSQHDLEEGEMVQYLRKALERVQKARRKKLKTYHFPGRDKDQLFKADCYHDESTRVSLACDPNQRVRRIDRETDDPVVHYGLIASGNTVMRSAHQRDELRDREKVICFEMEAAGLMDNFPCLVIRGICDYSDDHKNDLWQPYAALAAAAYAKDLLRVVQPKEVENTKAIAGIIEGLRDTVHQMQKVTERIESMQQDKQRDEILRWLSPLEPLKRHQDVRSIRVPDTGQWLLEEPNFQDWHSGTNTNRVLCCSGIPGAGKTVIASLVIDYLTKPPADSELKFGLACVYCDYRDQTLQTSINLIGSLLGQLLSTLPYLPKEVIQLYERNRQERKPLEQGDVEAMLLHACQHFDRVYICVDALDECQHKEDFLKSLRKLLPSIQLFITGRPHIPATVDQYFVGALKITIEANKNDINKFVATKIDEDSARDKYLMDEKLKQEILGKIGTVSQKMFLLPALQIQMVLDERTKANRRSALNKLPTELYEAFGDTIERIRRQSRSSSDLAMDILMWAYLAERPLHVNEFFEALAVKLGDKNLDTDNFPSRQSWLDCCLGLVIVDEETSTVRLVHFSLQEYLNSRRKDLFKDGHDRIAKTCLTYLCFDCIADPPVVDTDELLRNFPFLDYAACQWGHHIRKEMNLSGQSVDLSVSYLQTQSKSRCGITVLLRSLGHQYQLMSGNRILGTFSGLHVAAFFGIHVEVVKLLIDAGRVDVDSKDAKRRTPLSWAAEKGHVEIAKFLIDTDWVDFDSKAYNSRTPLSWAAEKGHVEIVKLLIDTGWVDVDSKADNSRTPLSWAAGAGHVEVVKLLIDTSQVDVDSKDEYGETPLLLAVGVGHVEIVKLLIDTGRVNVESGDEYGRTPLSWAAEAGHVEIVKFLIDTGRANVESKDDNGWTPLSCAADAGHVEVVKLLIDTGRVNVDSNGWGGRTPLSRAAEAGHVEVVKLLIDTGRVNVDSKGGWGIARTPLSWAAERGHVEVVKLLSR